jgi:hypothetical protein
MVSVNMIFAGMKNTFTKSKNIHLFHILRAVDQMGSEPARDDFRINIFTQASEDHYSS